jgi:beta-lactamase superfamily II metal-dependent hydrolase
LCLLYCFLTLIKQDGEDEPLRRTAHLAAKQTINVLSELNIRSLDFLLLLCSRQKKEPFGGDEPNIKKLNIMKFIIYTVLAVATLTSCQLLKKEKLTLKTKWQKEELKIAAQKTTFSQKNELVLIDSSQNDFTMMLWPKGKFTFSLTNGFEGEAERVIIKGKQSQQKVLNIKRETKQDSTIIKTNYTNEKESSTTIKKNKLSGGYNWAWVFVIPILYLFYRLYKRYSPKSLTFGEL